MKVLTAVNTPPHRLDTDYSFTDDGEIVVPNASLVCDNPSCGCDRAVMGLKSRKGTTTMRVSELEVSEADIAALLQDYNDRTWDGRLDMAVLRRWWNDARFIAESAPVGSLLRIRAEGEDWVVSPDQDDNAA